MNPPAPKNPRHRSICRFLPALLCAMAGIAAQAAVIIRADPPARGILPTDSRMTMELFVINEGDPIQLIGVNLNLQIADGGPEAGGVHRGPSILNVDLFAPGALFAENNNGAGGNGLIIPQLFEVGTLTRPGTQVTLASGPSLLGVALLDTTGVSAGQQWSFTLDTLNGSTVLLNPAGQPITLTLQDGVLTVVPEPLESGLAVALLVGAFAVFRSLRHSPRNAGPAGKQQAM